MTHICVGNLTTIGSDNGLTPGRCQAIIWTNAGILLIGPLGTNFSEFVFDIHAFSFKKMHLKLSSAKWQPFCLGLNVLKFEQEWIITSYSLRGCNYLPWASYQIHNKFAGCACAGNAGNVSPRRRLQRKQLVGDPGMPHGTCVTHVPWCMSGSLTRGDGENGPGIPGACARAILGIWQEAHVMD